jgi:tRNA(fMet)-specific endonuclease VapC
VTEPIYLLDTNIIVALVRAGKLGQYINRRFELRKASQRPFVSIVSLGEVRVFAKYRNWGEAKLNALTNALDNLVTVDISHPTVIDSYIELALISLLYPSGARNMGKNDLWIAACAKAAKAVLLTTDKDFCHLIPDHLEGEVIDPAAVNEQTECSR